jgi:hypothetical protein
MLAPLNYLLLPLLILLWLVSFVHGKLENVAVPSMNANIDDLVRRLVQNSVHDKEVYSKAVDVLENIHSAPDCHRMATFSLVDSCQALEPSDGSEAILADVREEYATRLAMCELSGAKAQIPTQCTDFVPSHAHCAKSGQGFLARFRGQKLVPADSNSLCYADTTQSQLKACLYALHSKPQWWTSYSNAFNGVLVVCQASRASMERGRSNPLVVNYTHKIQMK